MSKSCLMSDDRGLSSVSHGEKDLSPSQSLRMRACEFLGQERMNLRFSWLGRLQKLLASKAFTVFHSLSSSFSLYYLTCTYRSTYWQRTLSFWTVAADFQVHSEFSTLQSLASRHHGLKFNKDESRGEGEMTFP